MSDTDRPVPANISRGADWRRWEMLSFDEPVVVEAPPEPEPDPGPSAEEILRQLQDQAQAHGHEQGYAQGLEQGLQDGLAQGQRDGYTAGREAGYTEGLVQAREQGHQEAQELNALVRASSISFAALEEKTGQSLLTLAMEIASQIVRTTLQEQPEIIVAAIREVLHINPSAGRAMRLWVHPADLELVRLHLHEELKEGHWRVLADESLTRGGCRAETPYGDIDATLETRWRRIAASLGQALPGAEKAE